MTALPAVDRLKNFIEPPSLKIDTLLPPAVALLENTIVPIFPEASLSASKDCARHELFVMPVPLMVSVSPGLAVMLYGFVAAEVNVMPLTSVLAEMETLVVVEKPNVATSAGPFGDSIWHPVGSRIPVA
jgi:hypothetical protein